MRVNNTGMNGPPLSGPGNAGAAGSPTPKPAGPASPVADAAYAPSAELAAVRELARALPEVRTDILADVGRRLLAGFYQTAESAERTAHAMVESGE